jgi:two-component system cell cycle sensor histidine kinase/response regulator CckA
VKNADPGRSSQVPSGAAAKSDASARQNIYQLAFEQMSSAVAIGETILDSDGKPVDFRIVNVNPAYERLTGLRADAVIGKPLSEVNPRIRAEVSERAVAVMVTGEPVEFDGHDSASDRFVHIRLSRVGQNSIMAMIEDVTGARRAEAALRERTSFAETIIASAGEGIVVYDCDLRYVVWNPVMEELTGLPAATVLGTSALETFPEVMAAGVGEDLEQAVAGSAPTSREFELVIPQTGRRRWVVQTNRPHRGGAGEIVGVVSSILDVTAKHEVEAAARRSEEAAREQARFLQELIDAIHIPIIAKDREGRIQLANAAFASARSGAPAMVVGKTVAELGMIEPEMHLERDRAVLADGKPQTYEAPMPVAGGPPRRHVITKAPLRSEDGTIAGIVIAGVDIHDRYEAEQALRRSEERFRTLFESAGDAIFMNDNTGRFLEVNQAACDRLGYSREELLAMSVADIDRLLPTSGFDESRDTILGQGGLTFETEHTRRDGTVIPVEIISRTIDLGGKPVVLSIARDVSERQRAEAERAALERQLREASKMEGVARLAGGVAHDFNNLLTVIRGNASLVLAGLPEGADMREELEEIEQAADRATGLTRQLLAFARRTVLKPEIVDPSLIVQSLAPMLRRLVGEDIVLETIASAGTGRVLVDPGQLEQVIVNLVVNARDAMPNGGKVTIAVADVETDEPISPDRPATAGPMTMLSVSDTGIGMDAATLERLFEPFFTTKDPSRGIGLGLATVYGIVRMSGGTVTAGSELGLGSTLTVYLPRVEAGATPAAGPESKPRPAARGTKTGTVLVVEDDSGVRRFASRVLESAGYTVLTAPNGAAAVELPADVPVDLLLTDVVMPGMSGRDVASKLAAARPGIRVLYMSGHTDKGIVHDGVLEPGIKLLGKPFTAEALLAAVEEGMTQEPAV